MERLVHKTIDRLTDLRIRQNREFFNVAPEVALDIFHDIAQTIDDAVVTEYKNNQPVFPNDGDDSEEQPASVPRRGRFKFSMVGIKIGETVVFTPTQLEVKVASDNTVEYEGRIYKLSPFVGTFMPVDKRNASGAYQGSKYFSYKGRLLDDLRSDAEALS